MNNKETVKFSDEQIIELYWKRDEKAIRATDIKYGKRIFHIAYNILHDKSDSEECQNDTYLRIWKRIPPTRPSSLLAFASKISRDAALDKYKMRMSQKRIPSELTVSLEELTEIMPTYDLAEKEYEIRELSQIISNYLREIPKRQKYIFMGRFYFGCTMEEIADKLSVNASTVQREIVKIKQNFKIYLERNGVYL